MDIKIAQFRIEHLTGAHRHRFTVSYLALQIWEFILEVQKESPVSTEDRARELVQRFITSAYASRELLVSLIERVELTEDKQIIVKFRFRELEAIS